MDSVESSSTSSSSAFKKRQRKFKDRKQVEAESTTTDINNEATGSDNEDNLQSVLADVRDLQKMREKPSGLSVEELGSSEQSRNSKSKSDPLNLRVGGILDKKMLKSTEFDEADIEGDIKAQFSKESHLRDEDDEMRKYVEAELNRRRGGTNDPRSSAAVTQAPTGHDLLFQMAAERLKKYSSKRNEDMLSNQMLCGIPEIDLGTDAKIRNIEETEAVKLKLLKKSVDEQKSVKEATSYNQDIVKDLACDYVRHRIYDIKESTSFGAEDAGRASSKPVVPVVGDLDTPSAHSRKRKLL